MQSTLKELRVVDVQGPKFVRVYQLASVINVNARKLLAMLAAAGAPVETVSARLPYHVARQVLEGYAQTVDDDHDFDRASALKGLDYWVRSEGQDAEREARQERRNAKTQAEFERQTRFKWAKELMGDDEREAWTAVGVGDPRRAAALKRRGVAPKNYLSADEMNGRPTSEMVTDSLTLGEMIDILNEVDVEIRELDDELWRQSRNQSLQF